MLAKRTIIEAFAAQPAEGGTAQAAPCPLGCHGRDIVRRTMDRPQSVSTLASRYPMNFAAVQNLRQRAIPPVIRPQGSMVDMVRRKATITLDRDKAASAMALAEVHTMSEVIDLALTRLIHTEQLRRDIAAYRQAPPADVDIALADIPVTFDLDDADVDYEADYRTAE